MKTIVRGQILTGQFRESVNGIRSHPIHVFSDSYGSLRIDEIERRLTDVSILVLRDTDSQNCVVFASDDDDTLRELGPLNRIEIVEIDFLDDGEKEIAREIALLLWPRDE